ncbi:hypothetical protein AQJ46_49695 [Streptomyces canus]|uniref:ChsH2 C-terminal OB-fold domain-containing protein n=1 Tax=Streptomyces canus TaxID=58343 RepID=A0A117QVW9_9ACTN|nr:MULTISPECIES: OB-fold domain-containing protein [Streptomyces]KUN54921.1 hypothetical protein AQJ46_49695 [Streptomyces canus]MDI5906478.1 OB-fold domain-containing protein [Streptomyces sp. 12257]
MRNETAPTGVATRVVAAEYFTHGDDGVHLRITECRNCSSRWFPPGAICSRCAGTNLTDVNSGTTGVAYASTVVRVGPPGFPAPYVLSYVDIDGVRVLAHTEGDSALTPDTPVALTLGEVGNEDGTPLVSYVARAISDGVGIQTEGDR